MNRLSVRIGIVGAIVWSSVCAAARADGLEPQVTEAIVNAPVAEMWNVFATPEGYKKLGVAKCDMDFRIGGLIRSHYNPAGVLGDEGTIQQEILAYEPQRMLAFHIQKPPKGFPFAEETWKATWSVVTLTDLGDGRTHVRLTGMGYADTEDGRKMREFFAGGNAWVMKKLQQQYDAAAEKPTGPAHPEKPLSPIHHERVVELPRHDVWNLLATSDGWKRLIAADARVELRPGGKFEILFGADAPKGEQGSEGCTVLSVVPEEVLSFSWNAPPKFAYARQQRTWVVVRLDEISAGRTRVRIDHEGFAEQAAASAEKKGEWEEVRAYFQVAWGKVLDAVEGKGGKRE